MALIVAQIIGLMAVSLYLFSYQLRKRLYIVWATCVANGLYVVQYLLLGAYAGAIMDVVSTIASFFAAKKDAQRKITMTTKARTMATKQHVECKAGGKENWH